jgi:AAA15 family ATPase/GTPase
MLTRIEINGFKTFEQFSLDLEPMQVILGQNASGKSNLFDAIRLLSNLASSDVRSSVRDLRGEPIELFRVQEDLRIALVELGYLTAKDEG